MMGGSGGSQKINETVRNSLPQLLSAFQIIHICGKEKVDPTIKHKGYVQFEYIHKELKHIFAASDYVSFTGGSNAIFEFLALQKPMLLIPCHFRQVEEIKFLMRNRLLKSAMLECWRRKR